MAVSKCVLMKVLETRSKLLIGHYEAQVTATISRFRKFDMNAVNEISFEFLQWASTLISYFIWYKDTTNAKMPDAVKCDILSDSSSASTI